MKIDIFHQYGDFSHFNAIKGILNKEYIIDPLSSLIFVLKDGSFSRFKRSICTLLRLINPFSTFHSKVCVFSFTVWLPHLIFFLFLLKLKYKTVHFHTSFTDDDSRAFIKKFFIEVNCFFIKIFTKKTFCVSRESTKFFKGKGISTKTIFHSIDNKKYTQRKSRINLHPKFCYLGRDASYKNLDKIIHNFSKNKFHIDLIGKIDKKYGTNENINLLGFKNKEWIQKNLCNYDCLIVASDYREPFGIVYLEAVFSNVCIISTRTIGLINIFKNQYPTELLIENLEDFKLEDKIDFYNKSIKNINDIYKDARNFFSSDAIKQKWISSL